MRKITFILTLLLTTLTFSQNLIVNGDFESPGTSADPIPAPWLGYKNRIVIDNITSSLVGQGTNSDSSMFQNFSVTTGSTYNVSFEYRWDGSAGAANTNMIVRVKDADIPANNLALIGGTISDGYTLNTTVDIWYTGSFSFVIPTGVTNARLLFFKATTNKSLNLDNISVTLDATASLEDLQKFNFNAYPNPATDYINLSASKNIDKIEIYNVVGQQVESRVLNSNNNRVNVSNLSKGIYIMKAFIEDAIGTYKFVKE